MIKLKNRYKELNLPNIPLMEKIKLESNHKEIIKLNYNESNYGPTPKVLNYKYVIHDPHRYPMYHSTILIDKLANLYDMKKENFWISNGSDAILDAIPSLFSSIKKCENIIIPSLTYGRILQTCLVHGIEVQKVELKNGHLDLEKTLKMINDKTSVIYIVNPNMPTGRVHNEKPLVDFLKKVPKHILVVIDEAYISYHLGLLESFKYDKRLLSRFNNLLITRTFSKLFGLAGYRIGYLISSKNIVELFKKAIQIFPLTNASTLYASKALSDLLYYEKIIKIVRKEKEKYYNFFNKYKIDYYKSGANFIYINTKQYKWKNKDLRIFLLNKYGVLIRNVGNFASRITMGTPKENDVVMKGIKDFLNEKNI